VLSRVSVPFDYPSTLFGNLQACALRFTSGWGKLGAIALMTACAMASKKYHLQPLLNLREDATEQQARAVAAAQQAEQERLREVARAAAARDEHAAQVRAQESAYRGELQGGALRASDLALQAGMAFQAVREASELQEREAAAQATARAAAANTVAARTELGKRDADAEAVRRHREAHHAAIEKVQNAREEEAAEEAWRKR
jgi:hypothetical protein